MSAQPIRWELWALSEEADRRFRRICAGTAAPLLSLALLFTLYRLELPPRPQQAPPQEKRYVELLRPPPSPRLEARQSRPPPRSEPRHAEAQPRPAPAPAEPAAAPSSNSARELAEHSGLMQLREQLAGLREQHLGALSGQKLVSTAVASDYSSGAASGRLAAGAAATSGGIGSGGAVTAQGGTGLGERRTGGVHSGLGSGSGLGDGGGTGTGIGDGRGARRSLAEIQEVFDRNKGPFVALYNRAARATPGMEAGRVVLSLVIAPDGSVTSCSIVSSSFADADLEQKILQRVRMLNFGAKNVPPFSYPNYPISFLAS
jgi:TonB family protein